ncbi:hypothetical protein EYF80_018703 [Liparis tanakae]|uniref:Uncharacterized protein n=1 Tax=Liparis tanakae TaxID=230148 RepID=A0A4Z2I1C2_9TELE|nr:hypothetical protein EYF80_018703 [Liparis tanakae]
MCGRVCQCEDVHLTCLSTADLVFCSSKLNYVSGARSGRLLQEPSSQATPACFSVYLWSLDHHQPTTVPHAVYYTTFPATAVTVSLAASTGTT